jgi:CRISPR/Cas system-associated exonuclease Cas4 (RecB family)
MVLNRIHQNDELQSRLADIEESEYEIIIDYKGMRRPPASDPDDPTWTHHKWQVLTYAWLRSQQPDSKPVAACFLFYLNELEHSQQDVEQLQREVKKQYTDMPPRGHDKREILTWEKGKSPPNLTLPFKEERSLRIVPIVDVEAALSEFDSTVSDIESSVAEEMRGEEVQQIWSPNPRERVCTACDFKTYCPDPADDYSPTTQ